MNLEKVMARFNQLSTAAARLDGILPILARMVFLLSWRYISGNQRLLNWAAGFGVF